MNTANLTDNRKSIIVNPETGEVTEITAGNIATGEDILHENEPKAIDSHESVSPAEAKVFRSIKPNYIFFNAREWKPSKECDKTVATRSFISDPFGGLTEAYTVGDWSWNWSQIETKDMVLEKNTDYEFIFWLNGGENDQNQEICRFEIMFDNDHENRYIYNLNRNFIRYIRHYKGWYLYGIPFNTGDACYTKFRFIAQRAYSTLMRAESAEGYSDLPEDIPPKGIPQRHNIIFSEGWPRNQWWSKMIFNDDDVKGVGNESEDLRKGFGSFFAKYGNIADMVRSRIEEELENELDADDIADEIADTMMDDIDIDSIKDRIIQQVKDSLS